ncbi:MAG TPA: hypothetical protein VGY98_14640, partial [Verrucomicrobiae bacterium]|nr:hypothetical protein [Verrucomicrobiae bacterium]
GTPKISSGAVILTGNNGTPNSGYTLLSTTNLSAPVKWTTNRTGTLNAAGALSNVIPVTATSPAGFFRLRVP